MLDFFEQLGRQINPIRAVLAETFISLNACRKLEGIRFRGCAHLLQVWALSHFWKIPTLVLPNMSSPNFSPLREFLAKEWPEIKRGKWVDIFKDRRDEEIVWRVPWLGRTKILYKCGDYNYLMLLGVWGGIGCTPLLVSRQYGSRQFVPVTAGLNTTEFEFLNEFRTKDSRRVPWNYACTVMAPEGTTPVENEPKEGVVNEVGNFTKSGRCVVENRDAAQRRADAAGPKKSFYEEQPLVYLEPVKESEAQEFLKILKHSEYDVVEQLHRLPARISMLSLLLSSEGHRDALLKVLNQTFVPKEITTDKLDRLVNNIAVDNFISFSDEEIPEGGRGSYKALHISTRCKGHMLPKVLIDNGSALNVLPLVTLKKLPVDDAHMKTYHNTVRAFDGTQRDVLGKIEVPLQVGPCTFDVDFVVMEIKPTYSCLLGRPWIHTAGAVPSTLHQKLKFVIDGQLITINAEEDIIASVSTDAPYIEVDEDAFECTFRSLELINATFISEGGRIHEPGLSKCTKLQVRETLGKGAEIGRGFGKQHQGRLFLITVAEKKDRFGLGFKPNIQQRRLEMRRRQERRKARLKGDETEWEPMTFPPLNRIFKSGGFENPDATNEEGESDLPEMFKGLEINFVIEEDEESGYLSMICPCSELNNWIAEEIPVVFKSFAE
ncbi:hypothetical protein GQ457_11G025490 [Hibiscus cannabinus]